MIADTSAGPSASDFLKRFDLFAAIGEKQRREIVDLCELLYFPAGAAVCRVSEAWHALYFVVAGRARLVDDRNTAVPIQLDTVSQGSAFGERTVFYGEPGRFSVFAAAELTVLRLPGDAFASFLERHRDVAEALKQQEALSALRAFLATSSAFSLLAADDLALVASSLDHRRVRAGETLIREGDASTELFIVQDGRFRVYRGSGTEPVDTVQAGEIVGETAILTGARRNASIIAETDATVHSLSGEIFLQLVERQKQFRSSIESIVRSRTSVAAEKEPAEQTVAEPQVAADVDDALVWREPEYKGPVRRRRKPAMVRQQSQMDCGAACLATVCLHYGKRVSLNRVREQTRVGRSGASMLNIRDAARAIGFETIPVLSTIEHLASNRLPAIVNWGGYHWIVVYKVGPEVVVADPAAGVQRLSRQEFLKGWTRYTLFLRPTPAFASVEESPPTLQPFKRYLRPFRRMLLEITLASFAIQILALVLPLATKFVLDDVILKADQTWLMTSLIALSAITVASRVTMWIRMQILSYVTLRVNVSLLTDFYEHVLSLPLPYFESRKVGDIVSRFEENTKITSFFTGTGLDIFVDLFAGLVCLPLMLYYNVPITLVALAFLTLHILNMRILTPRLQHSYREVFERYAEMQSHAIESLGGLRTIKTLGIEHFIRWTWENLFSRLTNVFFKTIRYGLVSSLASQLVNNVSSVAVLFGCAWMVLRSEMTVGEMVAFTVLANNLVGPITRVVNSWDNLQETLISVERVNDVYEARVEFGGHPEQDMTVLPTLHGYLRFENVTFRYEPEGRNVLANINLEVRSGQRIAFVGRSGSGKSTLTKLLLGFYKPVSGRIFVDGFEMESLWLPSLRRQIGVVPQESFLFRATIRENIAQARPDANMHDIVAAARFAAAHDFISAMPQGYETMLEQQGANLSGGQRQRIAIARCLIQNPRMLVLDEATSALDNETERVVMQNLQESFPDCTVLMIAHRLSTIRQADVIVVIDHGNIIEMGSHQDLMSRKGLYYLLSTQQLNL